MKKFLLLGSLIFCSSSAFAQNLGTRVPVFAVSVISTGFAYQYQGKFLPFAGVGMQIEFMVGGRFYFYGTLIGEYLFSLSPESDSLQFTFGAGFGYIIKNNLDTKGFSFAINMALLGIGIDIRDIGTRQQNSSAFYRCIISFPLRFHYKEVRTVQLAPYVVLGAHTRGAVYSFMCSGGITLGLTF